MARVSQRRRQELSELIDAADRHDAENINCAQPIRSNGGARRLVYRRLRGIENTFDGSWPESTNIRCWYCRLPFDAPPVPIVQSYDSVKDQYDVYGICCSPACSKAYTIAEKSNDARRRLVWFSKMMIDVFNWPCDRPIAAAPPWQALDVFGGYIPIDKWRRVTPGVTIRLKKPPFVPFHIYTETERSGTAVIDEATTSTFETDDTIEEQAIQHGAPFSLKGLKRPPEKDCIKTWEQLLEKHPECASGHATDESLFSTFLREHPLPTDEQCRELREEFHQSRRVKRAERKRNKMAAAAAVAAATPTSATPEPGEPTPATPSPPATARSPAPSRAGKTTATRTRPARKKKAKRTTAALLETTEGAVPDLQF